MRRVRFGGSGMEVSELCVGTMVFGSSCDESEADRIVSAAMDRGANFLDTAEAYGQGECEALLGRVLKGRRDRVLIATKLRSGTPPEEIGKRLDESLQRLRTDYVDVYLLHWPNEGMEPRRIMSALKDQVEAGKARAIGCSNCPAWLVERFNAIAAIEGWTPMACHQVPYNPIERGIEVEVLPQAKAANVAITIYRSLLMGILSGKYSKGKPPPPGSRAGLDRKKRLDDWLTRYADALEKFNARAAELNVTPAQLAIAWVRHCPAVTCTLVGFSSVRQVGPTLDAFDLELTDIQRAHVSELFDAAVREEGGGNYPALRRNLDLVVGENGG